jgi:transketolase N-terminal domain/subunit
MRGYDVVALYAAGSGHAGGTSSIKDITAALYLKAKVIRTAHNISQPKRLLSLLLAHPSKQC